MNMKKKIILTAATVFVLTIISAWFFIFYKPTHFKRDVADENGIITTAKEIVKEFQSNEAASNAKYVNKAVEISGEVLEAKKDQTGNTILVLKSDDALSNVFVTLKSADQIASVGSSITIKGICTGFLSDVVIIDAIFVK